MQHADRVVAVAGVADDVRVAGADHLDAGRLLEPLEPAERVAQSLARSKSSRSLAASIASRTFWPDVAGAALEEVHHVRRSSAR